MQKSKLVIKNQLPTPAYIASALGVEHLLCIYDQQLLKYSKLATWLAQFENGFSVVAGESLKDIRNFPGLVEKILLQVQGFGPSKIGLAVIGGGSVGDSMGFLASTLKRGVPYLSVPSTWLAAIDSAHGGKTGLNVGHAKNQLGTFYPAKEVWISKELLATQSIDQRESAIGELAKIAFLSGGQMFEKLASAQTIDEALIWRLLPQAISAKNKIVQKDPFEKKGVRFALNLGHTLGHALELHHKIPHGEAVRLGLSFAIEWSVQRGYLKKAMSNQFQQIVARRPCIAHKVKRSDISETLRQDKKITDRDNVKFVFLEKPGRYKIQSVSVDEILDECERQGWTK